MTRIHRNILFDLSRSVRSHASASWHEKTYTLSTFFEPLIQVNEKLKAMMVRSFEEIWKYAQKTKISMREATFVVALKRIGAK